MKKVILIVSVLFFSCNGFDPPNNTYGYVVRNLDGWSTGFYRYYVVSVSGECKFIIYDTAGKYKIGDTLHLSK